MDPLFNDQCQRGFWPENRGNLSNEQESPSVECQLAAYQHVQRYRGGDLGSCMARFNMSEVDSDEIQVRKGESLYGEEREVKTGAGRGPK